MPLHRPKCGRKGALKMSLRLTGSRFAVKATDTATGPTRGIPTLAVSSPVVRAKPRPIPAAGSARNQGTSNRPVSAGHAHRSIRTLGRSFGIPTPHGVWQTVYAPLQPFPRGTMHAILARCSEYRQSGSGRPAGQAGPNCDAPVGWTPVAFLVKRGAAILDAGPSLVCSSPTTPQSDGWPSHVGSISGLLACGGAFTPMRAGK